MNWEIRLKILFKYIKQITELIYGIISCCFVKFTKTDVNMILFMSFHGRNFGDNPGAIYKKIQEQYPGKYKCIWVVNSKTIKEPIVNKVVKYNSIRFLYYMAKSKYWVINCKLPTYVNKKEDQVYLQTWHGTPLKKIGMDIERIENNVCSRYGVDLSEVKNSYYRDAQKYDLMVSPNKFSSNIFQSAFGVDECKLIETGYPRNDVLINHDENIIKNIKEKYNIPLDKKVILYAPTWRDDMGTTTGYAFKLETNFDKWYEELSDEYVVLFKPHYLINKTIDINKIDQFIFCFDEQVDISELFIISDILVTDYSSTFFDYANLGRPIYFYMYDFDHYKDHLRGFYIDVREELPGEIYLEESTLIKDIKRNKITLNKLGIFNNKFNYLECGESSERVISALLKDGVRNETETS